MKWSSASQELTLILLLTYLELLKLIIIISISTK